jgi:ectoine hydroxylase-related dioxygenase (phytanoyl-CoA dioxygenase family)
MPAFIMTVQFPLTDIDSLENGPTEYVPGSQYSGRWPNDKFSPQFEDQDPRPMLCKAGDIYLHNGQCWHRGVPNRSDRMRYLLQGTYSVRWVSQRFYPFGLYRLPQHVIDNADERRRRVLGIHPGHGGYG